MKLLNLTVTLAFILLFISCKKETLMSAKADFLYKKEFKYFVVGVDTVLGRASVCTGNIFGIDYDGNVKYLFKDTASLFEIKICKGNATELFSLARTVKGDIILKKYDLANKLKTKEFILNKASFSTFSKMVYNRLDNSIYIICQVGLVRINVENGSEEPVIDKQLSDIKLDEENNIAYYTYAGDIYKYNFANKQSTFLLARPSNAMASSLFYNKANKKIFVIADTKLMEADIANQVYSAPLFTLPYNAYMAGGDYIFRGNKFTYCKSYYENEVYEVDLDDFSEKLTYLTPHIINGNMMNEFTYSNY